MHNSHRFLRKILQPLNLSEQRLDSLTPILRNLSGILGNNLLPGLGGPGRLGGLGGLGGPQIPGPPHTKLITHTRDQYFSLKGL